MQIKECDGRSLLIEDFCLNITTNTAPEFNFWPPKIQNNDSQQSTTSSDYVLTYGENLVLLLPDYTDAQNDLLVHYFIQPVDGLDFPDQKFNSTYDAIYIEGDASKRTIYLNATEYGKQYSFQVCVGEMDAPDLKNCQKCSFKVRKKPFEPLVIPVPIDVKFEFQDINRDGEVTI